MNIIYFILSKETLRGNNNFYRSKNVLNVQSKILNDVEINYKNNYHFRQRNIIYIRFIMKLITER